MKAVYAKGVCGEDPLSMLEVGERPEPDRHEFWSTIAVRAVSLNHHDLWSLQGVGLSPQATPMILGTDAAGILEDDIPGTKGGPKAGSRVIPYTVVGGDGAGVGPGEGRSILSERHQGTMAAKVAVPSAHVLPMPGNLTFQEASALGTSWLTAYSMIFTAAGVKPGDSILIQGAGGGVSTASLQLAHAAGLEVFVTSRRQDNWTGPVSWARMVLWPAGNGFPTRWMQSWNRSGRPPGPTRSGPSARAAPSSSVGPLQETSRVPN